jgi:uncharacterized ubiquitin-like protein YukD
MFQENYLVDKNGRRIAVQIPVKRYIKLIADSEELNEIKEYRKTKSQKEDTITFGQAD